MRFSSHKNYFRFIRSKIIFFRIIYSCALNGRGRVESDFIVTILESGDGHVVDPSFDVINVEIF